MGLIFAEDIQKTDTMTKTLLILAAGMGSRYGGLKQMDGFGPNEELLMEYSIYDAVEAGFDKCVFIIRESFSEAFKEVIHNKWKDRIELVYVHQETSDLPEGASVSIERPKPWGTGHAVWAARDVIDGPFVMINADDFYGRPSYLRAARFFDENESDYAVLAYQLGPTLSEHGTVNRGICFADETGNLTKIIETKKIDTAEDGSIVYEEPADAGIVLKMDTLASMNMFCLRASYFEYGTELFSKFLDDEANHEKGEFLVPSVIDHAINNDLLQTKVIDSESSWFGVTYKADQEDAKNQIEKLIADGVYPQSLADSPKV